MGRSVGVWRGVLAVSLLLLVAAGPRAGLAAEAECATPKAISADAEPGKAPSPELVTGIETLVETVAACQSDGDAKRLAAIVTPGYLGDAFAGGGRLSVDAYLALAPELPSAFLGIRAVDNVRVASSGNISAEVTAVRARQLTKAQWRFVPDPAKDGRWLVDGAKPLPIEAPEDADTAEITLKDGRYTPGRLRVEGPTVAITAENTGKADHELLVLQIVDEDVDPADLLLSTNLGLPDGVRFVGQQTVLAGETANLVLVSIKPGEYLIVDMLPTPDGIPNLSLGMMAELIVR